ncbi:MAG TPA: gliding motility-associated C-terminal domain-containing protein [Chitinophagales bacterium]|nr:gliding motility-associated C-terminal domain-containing protein [Chitinophagales bacterium]
MRRIFIVSAFLFCFLSSHEFADAQITIISDGTWKASTVFDPNWTDVNFDDSGWGNSVSPAPNGVTPIVPGSQSMWTNGIPPALYFRKKITLNNPVSTASCSLTADNEFDLYVNGTYVGTGNNWANIYSFNIQPYLNCGDNEFAIKGIEWIVGTPSLVSFKADIDTLPLTLSVNLGNDTSICGFSGLLLDAQNPGASYLWNDSSTAETFLVITAGSFYVTVTDSNLCKASDTINITTSLAPAIDLGEDTTLCNNTSMLLDAGAGFIDYVWQDSSNNQTLSASAPGVYYVTITNSSGCTVSDTIVISLDVPSLNLGNDTTFCGPFNLLLDAQNPGSIYLWQDGSNGQTFSAITAGSFYVTVIDSYHCTGSDTIIITLSSPPVIDLGTDSIFCNTVSLFLDAGSGFSNYLWQNGSVNETFAVNLPGIYTVTVKDSSGCSSSDSIVIILDIPTVNLGNDTVVCKNIVITLNSGNNFVSCLWNTGSLSPSVAVSPPGFYSVIATDSLGCTATDTMRLDTIEAKQLFLSGDTTLCREDPLTLNAWDGYSKYIWLFQNGTIVSQSQTCLVSESGNYSVVAQDEEGCLFTGDMTVFLLDCYGLYVPDAFTPNHDGLNDGLKIIEQGNFQLNKFEIFDRWGEMVFATSDINAGWDGTYKGLDSEVGVYVYWIEATNESLKVFHLKGNITLIR